MRRLLTLLLCALIGLGGAGGALAAPAFPDLTGSAAVADIISLHALGIIDGYPDGTFRPDAAITRAEFAAIVVEALGRGHSADPLRNTATRFSDVAPGQWFTGPINVAEVCGISKGYADGTFRPDECISQAEAATMLLRAMGYDDNLPGDWPLNYFTMAAIRGIIGAGFTAEAPASRAFAAAAVMRFLDCGAVTWDRDRQAFSDPAPTPILAVLGVTRLADAVVTSHDADTDELTLATTPAATIHLAVDADVTSGEVPADLIGRRVSCLTRSVDCETEIICITPLTPVVRGTATAINADGSRVTLTDGSVLELAAGCIIRKNGGPATIADIVDSELTAFLDVDGRAERFDLRRLDTRGRLTAKAVRLEGGAPLASFVLTDAETSRSYTVPAEAIVIRNGVAATFVDLMIGDDIQMAADGGAAQVIDAFAKVKEAAIVGYNTTVDGDEPVVRVDFADGTSLTVDSEAGPMAINVDWFTAFALNRSGQIVVKLRESPYSGALVGSIVTVGTTVTSDGTTRQIALKGGAALPLADTAQVHLNLDDTDFALLKAGQVAQLRLNGAGQVERIDAYINGRLPDGYWDLLDHWNLAPECRVTLNSAPADVDDVWWQGDQAEVTWNPVDGLLTTVRAYDFTSERLTVIGTTMADDGTGTLRYSLQDVGGSVTLPQGFVVERNGASGDFADIAIGDKLDLGPLGGIANKYVRLTGDTTFRADDTLTGSTDITVTAQASGIHIHFADAVASLQLYINGIPVTDPPLSASRREATVTVGPGRTMVNIIASDYAGHVVTLHTSVTVD